MQDDLSRREELIFSTIAQEAAGFYGLLLTLATSFLGATLVFVDRIAPNPQRWTLILLGLGWLSLIASVSLIAWVRWRNIESGRTAQAGDWDKEIDQERVTRRLTMGAMVLPCHRDVAGHVVRIPQPHHQLGGPHDCK